MKIEIKIPAMGESISEATVGTIIKVSGSQVAADDEILELETDKVNQVLYAPQAGTLTLTVKPEQVVKIGDVIGYVETEGKAAAKEPTAPEASAKETPAAESPVLEPTKPKEKAKEPEQKKAPEEKSTPVPSTGGARFTKEQFLSDLMQPTLQEPAPVQREAPQPRQSTPRPVSSSPDRPESRKKMTRVRKVIAERLVESLQTTAMLTTFNEVDMSQVMGLREKYKETFLKEHGVKLGFMSFFVKAAVTALEEYPDFNSYIDGDEIVLREYYDIGIAVGTERGLFVPVVRGCDKLSFAEIERAIEQYAIKAKEGKITVDELQGGGFTITNGGTYGSLLSTPILNPPQCGILGMHKIEKRPVVVNDQIVIRPMMYLALSYDHRIVDGKEAVSFLVAIKNFLEDPARLLLHI